MLKGASIEGSGSGGGRINTTANYPVKICVAHGKTPESASIPSDPPSFPNSTKVSTITTKQYFK